MQPLKAIFIGTAGFESIILALKKDKIDFTEWYTENDGEIRVEVDDIIDTDGETKKFIKNVLRKTYSYNETEIENTFKEYDYIIFF